MNKKAATYIIFLIGIAFIVSLLLTFIITLFYSPDHQKCEEVDMNIISYCREGERYSINIRNHNSNDVLLVKINGKTDISNRVQPGESRVMFFLARDISSNQVNIVPGINVEGVPHYCKGKTVRINSGVIGIC